MNQDARWTRDPANDGDDLAVKLLVAIEAADLGVWEWDLATGEFTYSNRAKAIFGLPIDRPVSRQQIVDLIHPDDHRVARQQAERSLDPTFRDRHPYRYRIYRADDGALRWIRAFGQPIFEERDGAPVAVRFVGTLQDVTEETLAKERLELEEARLRLAVEASGIAIWELDLATQTVTHSPDLNRMCGFPADARLSLEDFRSRYAPGERERIERLGAEARARGETRLGAEIRHLWPDGSERWLSLRAQLAPGASSEAGRVIGVLVDVTEQKRREEQQSLLLSELKHRIKNSFAVTQAIVSQSLRGEEISTSARTQLFGRLQALSEAHDEIVSGAWDTASLIAVIRRASAVFKAGWDNRLVLTGEDVVLHPRAALSFALVLHELFTNATKYGALANDTGTVGIDLAGNREGSDGVLEVVWSERGGPPVQAAAGRGFGTRLMERLFQAELRAEVDRRFEPEGLWCRIRIPMEALTSDDER